MITTAAKLWFAIAGLAFVGALFYGFTAHGEWFGSFVLGTISLAALVLGSLAVALRDSVDNEGPADEVLVRRSLPAAWPAFGALGAGVAGIGLAGHNALLYVGIGIIAATFFEWMVQGWAERATGDHAYNRSLRDRIMSPIEIPIIAVLVIGFVLLALSRVLLSVSDTGSTAIALAVATAILVIGSLVATRPRMSSSILAGLLAVGAVALLAAGVAGGVAGHREFEHHGEDHVDEQTTGDEQGNNAVEDQGGEDQSDPGADPTGADTDGKSSGTGDEVTEPGADSNSTPASTP